MHLNVFMLNETNDHILVYMIFMFLKFCTSYLIPIHFFGIWLLNALLFILEPISGAFIIHVSTLYLIWENSKFFWRCTKLMYTTNFLYVLPFLQTVTGLCADLAQLAGANILEGVIFS